jgi:hypothetical protein
MINDPDYLQFRDKITLVDDEKISSFTTHGDFNEIGVELFKEVALLIVPVAASYKQDEEGNSIPFDYEQAAVIGNLVRYCKLCNGFLEQFTKKRLETSLIFFRCLAETYINLKYFLKFKDQNTIRHYIKNSLRQEKDLLEILKRNITDKQKVEHIEARMIDSINRSFRASDFEEDEISNSSKWNDKIKARIKEIIDPDFYVLIYGNASHSIHGNWQDIITFHLTKERDGFLPDTDWTYPTLQIIFSATVLSCDLLHTYAEEVLPDSENKKKLIASIEYIMTRAFKLDRQHELFIQRTDQKDNGNKKE